ncbi:hypothetical protein ABZ791_02050 [Streptomyces huasconensis]|uniref:Uncharacterized protein n=1 Tax=Streptomyces huasconensis TaxID=1854574 RepID=A0ABV3LRL1_9ACTN
MRLHRVLMHWDRQWDYDGRYFPVQTIGSSLLSGQKTDWNGERLVVDRANDLAYYADEPSGHIHEFDPQGTDTPTVVLNPKGVTYRSCCWLPYSGRLYAGHAKSGKVDVYGRPKGRSRRTAKLHDIDLGAAWSNGVRDLAVARVPYAGGTATLLCALSEHLTGDNSRALTVRWLETSQSARGGEQEKEQEREEEGEQGEAAAPRQADRNFDVPKGIRFLAVDPWRHTLLATGGDAGVFRLPLRDPQSVVRAEERRAVLGRAVPHHAGMDIRYAYMTNEGPVTRALWAKPIGGPATLDATIPVTRVSDGDYAKRPSLLAGSADALWVFEDRGGQADIPVGHGTNTAGRLRRKDLPAELADRNGLAVSGGSSAPSYVCNAFAFRGARGEPLVYLGMGSGMRRILQDKETGRPVEKWDDGSNTHLYPFQEIPLPYRDLFGPAALRMHGAMGSGAFVRDDKVHFLLQDTNFSTTKVSFDPNGVADPRVSAFTSLDTSLRSRYMLIHTCCEVDADRVLLICEDLLHNPPSTLSWCLWNMDADHMDVDLRVLPDGLWPTTATPPFAAFRGYDTMPDPTSRSAHRVLRLYDTSGKEVAWTIGRNSGGEYRITRQQDAPPFLAGAGGQP